MENIKPRNIFVAVILSILSLLLPGIGHLFGARCKRFFVVFVLFIILLIISGLIIEFDYYRIGVAILYLSGFSWFGFLLIDSYLVNRKKSGIEIKWYNRWYFYILGAVLLFFIANVQAIVLSTIGIRVFRIPNVSNSPTLQVNDLFIAKMNYGKSKGFHYVRVKSFGDMTITVPFITFRPAKYLVGNFVLFEAPNKTIWVKRIVALSGDRFAIRNGKDYLNGKLVKNYSIPRINRRTSKSIKFGPITVPAHHILVLGDNRDNSKDSKELGPISMKYLRGKALFVFWSSNYKRIGNLL